MRRGPFRPLSVRAVAQSGRPRSGAACARTRPHPRGRRSSRVGRCRVPGAVTPSQRPRRTRTTDSARCEPNSVTARRGGRAPTTGPRVDRRRTRRRGRVTIRKRLSAAGRGFGFGAGFETGAVRTCPAGARRLAARRLRRAWRRSSAPALPTRAARPDASAARARTRGRTRATHSGSTAVYARLSLERGRRPTPRRRPVPQARSGLKRRKLRLGERLLAVLEQRNRGGRELRQLARGPPRHGDRPGRFRPGTRRPRSAPAGRRRDGRRRRSTAV